MRTESKGEDAARKIIERTGRKGVIEVWPLDMMDYPSIKAFAKRAETQLERLDIAVLNAGVMKPNFGTSKYGYEETMQVNVLSTAYLALLLVPKLKASKTSTHTPVLEIIGSGNHLMVSSLKGDASPFAAYNEKASYDGTASYSVSKLFVMYIENHLAQIMKSPSGSPDSYVVVACPGATQSDLARDANAWYMKIIIAMFTFLVQKTTEEGARQYISGAELGEKGHGKFWIVDRLEPSGPLTQGEKGKALSEKVWEEVLTALEKDVPDARELASSKT